MSPIIDDRGRLGGKVSVVDLLVLLLLAAVAVFAFMRFSSDAGQERPVKLTLTVEEVREPTVVQFEVGDSVHEDTGIYLGTIEDVTVTPTQQEVPTADGDLKGQPSPVFSDVNLELRGTGTVSSSSIEIGGRPVRVGKQVVITGPGWEVRAQVRGVEPVE
jgi:hypothetical protein